MPPAGWSLNATPRRIRQQLGIDRRVRRAVFTGANALRNTWQEVLETPGSGVTYDTEFITTAGTPRRVVPVGKRVPHTASAPGDPPAKDTGASAASVVVQMDTEAAAARVGTNRRTLRALEWGVNVPGSQVAEHPAEGFKIEPRPHARVAYPRAKRRMRDEALRALRGG